jgi:hypothetical protein
MASISHDKLSHSLEESRSANRASEEAYFSYEDCDEIFDIDQEVFDEPKTAEIKKFNSRKLVVFLSPNLFLRRV